MAKVKSSDALSLDKGEQKKIVKQTKKLKKNIKDGKIVVKQQRKTGKLDIAQSRGLIHVAHIPHGFYETEMKNYFKQFGAITNIKVCRSRKNGNSKGFGYVEFLHPDVAKIAAETMNNYLMFKKRIIAEYVPFEKRPKGLFKGKASIPTHYSSKVRRDKQILANSTIDSKTHLARSKSRLSKLKKKMQRLQDAGIDGNIELTNLPNGIKQEKDSEEENSTHTYQQDPFDSDIEVKIPLKRSKKSVKSTVSKTSSKKSRSSGKSKSVVTTPSNKILLAKSLDSVKALLSKGSSKSTNVTSIPSVKKVNKATSVPKLKKVKAKKEKKVKITPSQPKGIQKKAKTKKSKGMNADMLRKIARELIRTRGDSLLNLITPRKKSDKKKAEKTEKKAVKK
ncbi:hypothetical protein NQ318_013691 [Aromia moschata]|uniref:RRM domain-containing protein n=1 Tax=Aromia moschata TaxID=1265417 RepID=A0AAV8Z9Z3_9CUCU|nr:hypothetical protein NQ318_013691 [Aromia moschata]